MFAIFTSTSSTAPTVAYSDFVTQVKAGNVATANFNGTLLTGDFVTAVSGSKTYQHQAELTALVAALKEHETLDRTAITKLLAGISAPRVARG